MLFLAFSPGEKASRFHCVLTHPNVSPVSVSLPATTTNYCSSWWGFEVMTFPCSAGFLPKGSVGTRQVMALSEFMSGAICECAHITVCAVLQCFLLRTLPAGRLFGMQRTGCNQAFTFPVNFPSSFCSADQIELFGSCPASDVCVLLSSMTHDMPRGMAD